MPLLPTAVQACVGDMGGPLLTKVDSEVDGVGL